MKNLTKGLLIGGALTALSLQNISADTNKTFLAVRPELVNLAMELPTWHTQINQKLTKEDNKFGASMQAVGFYAASTNDDDLGEYFGFNDKRNLIVGTGGAAGVDIDRNNLIHRIAAFGPNGSFSADNIGLKGTLNLSFERQVAGVRFDYYQDLHCLLKGLFFKVRSAVVWEQTEAELGLAGSQTQTVDPANGNSGVVKSISDYFSGNLTQPAGANQQAALRYAKIDGEHSETALADIDFILGWNFYETHKHHAGINFGVTFPTGPEPDMEELFEPVGGGNRGHWGVGAGFDGKATMWHKNNQKLQGQAVINWRYLFKGDEKRTFNVNGKPWSQYMFVGTIGAKGVQPLANVSTLDANVTPGNYVDSAVVLSYLNGNFTLDLGYNPYWQDKEDVDFKDSFPSNTYGFAGTDYNANNNFTTGDIALADVNAGTPNISLATVRSSDDEATGTTLAQSDLTTGVAETPSQLTHKVFAGLGYAFNQWDTPLMLGVSGFYEFASDEKSLSQWGIQGRVGISF